MSFFFIYKYRLLNRTCTIKYLKQNKSGTLLGTVKHRTSLTRRYMNLRKSKSVNIYILHIFCMYLSIEPFF